MAKTIAVMAVLCVMLGGCVVGRQAGLYAGTAKVDITPDQAVVSAEGEGFRLPDNLPAGEKTPPDKVHDPLYARVLVLKNKDVSVAIVSVDVMIFSSKHVVDEAKRLWGVDHVLLCSTLNHSGMLPRGLCPTDGGWDWSTGPDDPAEKLDWPGLSDDPWYAATEDKIVSAIGEATQDLFRARVASGKSEFECDHMAHNRWLVTRDGTVMMLWENANRRETKPLDPTVRVVRVDDETGTPRALMVHYACHPIFLMGAGYISSDFPGAAVDCVEEKLGASCMGMFLQGAAGDLNPYVYKLRGEQGFDTVRKAGTALGEAAVRVAETLSTSPTDTDAATSLHVKENMVKIPHQVEGKSSDVCIATVVVDDAALVTIPGIPFIQNQLNLSEKSPVPNTLMLGEAYCGQGSPFLVYVATVETVKQGGFGATECSFVAGDAGDRMVNAAVDSINELLAK